MRIGIIGGNGWIGGAVARAVVGTGLVPAESLALSCRSAPPGWLPEAQWTHDNQALADRSDVVILSVRPQDWPAIAVTAPGKLVVSVMAGVTHADYMTGLSGTGPAYPALLAVALMRDAVAHGLPPEVARRAVTAMFVGAGRLLEKYGENPEDTVAAFVDYRGVTAAGIEAMRAAGFDAVVAAGLAAALEKSFALRT